MSPHPFCARVLAPLRDELQGKLETRFELDILTGCWIYTGCWDPRTGEARIRVLGKMLNVSRVSLWVYRGGFELLDMSLRIYHARCRVPACYNPDHLAVAASPAKLVQALARLGRIRGGRPRKEKLCST